MRDERRETRDERRAQTHDAGAGWLASRFCSPRVRVRASGVRHTVWGLPLLAAARAIRRTAAESRCQQENSRGKPGSRVSCFCELPPLRGARSGAEAAGRGGAASVSRRCDQGCCLFFSSAPLGAPVRCYSADYGLVWALSKVKPEGAPEEYRSPRAREEY
ncbi:hypothetical protein NDU88_006396 [Pleurodeles waltl]|uniref:Uncharacterized protein n=1 Tax=Pleurodeles waltl TaxID=8319 RepID=A0AAV7NQM3_PLEWA|nr:hypothetical protein NDU88_006396 [Pleurodeles waltl]